MTKTKIYINGDTRTIEAAYGVVFDQDSVSALLTPPPLKGYITNESAAVDGVQVLATPQHTPRLDKRDLQLTFQMHASNLLQFYTNHRKFCNELRRGEFAIKIRIEDGGTWIEETAHLLFNSMSQYSQFKGRMAKFVCKFTEPNPANRQTSTSQDIAQELQQ